MDYPYSETGERYWTGETDFSDPFAICSALAVLTKRLKPFINVLKLPVRNPMLVAKAAATPAAISNDRLILGVGTSPWPEDYTICAQQWEQRGPRCAEMIHILREAFTGQMVEHHGKFYDIPRRRSLRWERSPCRSSLAARWMPCSSAPPASPTGSRHRMPPRRKSAR